MTFRVQALVLLVFCLCSTGIAHAADRLTFLRIATGETSGSVFEAAQIIASSISQPPGAPACDDGGRCGVPGLIAIAQSANGVIENLEAVEEGRIDSTLVRADLTHWAFHGEGAFFGRKPLRNLRLVATLYDEEYHLVVAPDSEITTVKGLKGKRVAMGEQGSATLLGAERLLAAHGVRKRDIKRVYAGAGYAFDLLAAGDVDALILSAPVPSPLVLAGVRQGSIKLVPFDVAVLEKMALRNAYYRSAEIEAGTYIESQPALPTMAVAAQWVVNRSVDDGLVFQATWALWHKGNRQFINPAQLAHGAFDVANAASHSSIWLHPGAYRYYEQLGLADLAARPGQDKENN